MVRVVRYGAMRTSASSITPERPTAALTSSAQATMMTMSSENPEKALSGATIRVNCAAMLELPDPGLYRTTQPLPGNEAAFPAGVLVYVGQPSNGGVKFVVRPADNRRNRWFWRDPTTPLRSASWA